MNSAVNFICNNEDILANIHHAVTLLDYLRKHLKLTGTKESCREGDCGSCAVLIGILRDGEIHYHVENSCILPIGSLHGKHVVTIEGLNLTDLNLIQNSFVEHGATQCGFCTPGFIISLTGYLLSGRNPDYTEAVNSLDGNICRCTGYKSIRRSVKDLLMKLKDDSPANYNHFEKLIKQNVIPDYFFTIAERLKKIQPPAEVKITSENHVVGGGTDLFVQRWEEMLKKDIAILPSPSMKVWKEGNKIFIDSRVTISDFINSDVIKQIFPRIKEFFKYFGSNPIRNCATLGGNIVNASPIADSTNILLALNSTLHLKKEETEREVKLKNFFLGYKKLDLNSGELIDKISFDIPRNQFHFNFEKVSRRTYLDIASSNTSILIEEENLKILNIHLSAGGVYPYPFYLEKTVEYLKGKIISESTVLNAVKIAGEEIKPISDARGSAEYKSLLLGQLIKAHFVKLFPQIFESEAAA